MTVYAMVFPGQGSQTVGMLAKLAANYTIVESTFSEASAVLGYNLWQLVQQGPTKKLNKTYHAQPALLASSVAIWRIWQQQGGQMPILLAGHSLGEYSALVCAGSLSFANAIKLVAFRGRLMQEVVPEGIGAMSTIIGLNRKIITTICVQVSHGQVVSPANYNSPGQTVIAGHKEAVERANIACKEAGAKHSLILPISVPSHCVLMKPAAEKLSQALDAVVFKTPQIPVISNVDINIRQNPSTIRKALVLQLYNPVHWDKIIKLLASRGVEILLEMGPGKVLSNLTKHIAINISSMAVNDPVSLAVAIKQ